MMWYSQLCNDEKHCARMKKMIAHWHESFHIYGIFLILVSIHLTVLSVLVGRFGRYTGR